MVSAIIPYLLKTAQCRKISYRICEDNFSLPGCSCCGSGHVLFRNSGVDELIRQLLPEGLQHAEPQIPGEKLNIRIIFCKCN